MGKVDGVVVFFNTLIVGYVRADDATETVEVGSSVTVSVVDGSVLDCDASVGVAGVVAESSVEDAAEDATGCSVVTSSDVDWDSGVVVSDVASSASEVGVVTISEEITRIMRCENVLFIGVDRK